MSVRPKIFTHPTCNITLGGSKGSAGITFPKPKMLFVFLVNY